ncbi:14656_t:CDS:2 [Gigaspora margarita]|uniref:guanosine-diphosphatase n=1 Tax=Gigaspora margarita TaxID=4874 RepID=A0ABN7VIA6_GIGMA|nr:14656_t:CDS:2 [Gigaspora margarita]
MQQRELSVSNVLSASGFTSEKQSPGSDTNKQTIHSRRKSSLALDTAENGFQEAKKFDQKDEKMSLNNIQNKNWLRVAGFLLLLVAPIQEVQIPQASTSKITSSHCTVAHPGRQLIQYALMLDAGSTGSRIHVYKFNYCKESPELEDEIFHHIQPGLSAYPDDTDAAARSLDVLLKVALDNVPEELHHCTPIAVKATAGLRLLGQEKSARILDAVHYHLETNYPFYIIEDGGVAIMDGKDEGVYAWITVNYLLEKIGSQEKLQTAAIFDLGGGSTQIVFEPEMTDGAEVAEGEHRYELEYGGHKYVLYQHSYLHYGLMEARKAIKNFVVNIWSDKKNIDSIENVDSEHNPSSGHVSHPCLPKNYTEIWPSPNLSDEDATTLIGTGAVHAQCRYIVEQVLNKTKTCPLSPCSFDGVYQPPISETFSNNEIYVFSYFYDRVSPLGMPSEFSLKELRDLTDDVCIGNIDQFEHLPEAMKELRKNPHYCMDLSYIYGLLHIGYEIPLEREVKMAKKIKGVETGWCLGAAIAILDQKQWCKPS